MFLSSNYNLMTLMLYLLKTVFCPINYYPWKNMCFRIINVPMTFSKASFACIRDGAELAEFEESLIYFYSYYVQKNIILNKKYGKYCYYY